MSTIVGDAWVAIRPDTTGFSTLLSGAMSKPISDAESGFGKIGKAAMVGGAIVGAAVIGIGVEAVKMATAFQTSQTQLVTGAGESQKNLGMVSAGILNMAGQVGIGAQQLSTGMYMVESAGFHGAAALQILQIAAEGAKVGNADLSTVTDALTSALNAYHLPASAAVSVTNDLIATVATGKMHMEDLAGSLGKILPIAASLGIPLTQVTAAIASMTVQGTDAATATTSLRFILAALAGPTSTAAKEMTGLGVGMKDIPGITSSVAKELGSLGLHTSDVAATLAGPGGLPAALAMITAALTKQFPLWQTDAAQKAEYNAGLKLATGGTRGFTAALELTGPGASVFAANLKNITDAANSGGTAVHGFALIQQDFGFKIDAAKAAIGAWMIQVGTALLPMLSQMADWFTKTVIPALQQFGDWFMQKGVPAIAGFASVVGSIASVVFPPLVAVLGFVVGNLWLVEAAVAALIIRMLVLKGIAFAEGIAGWLVGLGQFVTGLTGAGAAAQAMAAKTVAAAAESAVATDGMAATGGKAFSALGLSATGLTLGIAALGAAAILVATHWDAITTAVSDFFTPASDAAGQAKILTREINGMAVVAAGNFLQSITTDTVAFGKALQGASQVISGTINPSIALMTEHTFALQSATWAAASTFHVAIAATSGYRVAVSDAQKAVDNTTAAQTASHLAMDHTATSLAMLQGGFSALAPPVQIYLNSLAESNKAALDGSKGTAALEGAQKLLAQSFDALGSSVAIGLPLLDKNGKLTGIASLQSDTFRANLVKLASQESGASLAATNAAIASWDASGGAIAAMTGNVMTASSKFADLKQAFIEQGTQAGMSGTALDIYVQQHLKNLPPALQQIVTAGGNADAAIAAYGKTIGLSGQALMDYVSKNPSLLQAFLTAQQAAIAAANAIAQRDATIASYGLAWTAAALAAAVAAQSIKNSAAVAALATPALATHGILAEGGIVNAPTSGETWTLHGQEAVVPRGKASPQLWQAMNDAIAGKWSSTPLGTAGLPTSSAITTLTSGRSGGSSVPVGGGASIVQHFTINGGNPGELQAVVARENTKIIAAINARRR